MYSKRSLPLTLVAGNGEIFGLRSAIIIQQLGIPTEVQVSHDVADVASYERFLRAIEITGDCTLFQVRLGETPLQYPLRWTGGFESDGELWVRLHATGPREKNRKSLLSLEPRIALRKLLVLDASNQRYFDGVAVCSEAAGNSQICGPTALPTQIYTANRSVITILNHLAAASPDQLYVAFETLADGSGTRWRFRCLDDLDDLIDLSSYKLVRPASIGECPGMVHSRTCSVDPLDGELTKSIVSSVSSLLPLRLERRVVPWKQDCFHVKDDKVIWDSEIGVYDSNRWHRSWRESFRHLSPSLSWLAGNVGGAKGEVNAYDKLRLNVVCDELGPEQPVHCRAATLSTGPQLDQGVHIIPYQRARVLVAVPSSLTSRLYCPVCTLEIRDKFSCHPEANNQSGPWKSSPFICLEDSFVLEAKGNGSYSLFTLGNDHIFMGANGAAGAVFSADGTVDVFNAFNPADELAGDPSIEESLVDCQEYYGVERPCEFHHDDIEDLDGR